MSGLTTPSPGSAKVWGGGPRPRCQSWTPGAAGLADDPCGRPPAHAGGVGPQFTRSGTREWAEAALPRPGCREARAPAEALPWGVGEGATANARTLCGAGPVGPGVSGLKTWTYLCSPRLTPHSPFPAQLCFLRGAFGWKTCSESRAALKTQLGSSLRAFRDVVGWRQCPAGT